MTFRPWHHQTTAELAGELLWHTKKDCTRSTDSPWAWVEDEEFPQLAAAACDACWFQFFRGAEKV